MFTKTREALFTLYLYYYIYLITRQYLKSVQIIVKF